MKNNTLIGFDIGATKIDVGLVEKNKILKKKTIPTPKNKKDFLAKISEIISELLLNSEKSIKGIGFAMAGVIDLKSGEIINSPNLPKLNGLNLKKTIEKKFGIPIKIDNDANCFLLAEAKLGAGRKFKNIVGLTLGSGIGAGIMIEGKLYRGHNGSAGEIGHAIIKINSKYEIQNTKQIMNNLYSFEDLAAKKGFLKLGIKDAKKLEDLAKKGNKKALRIYKIIGSYLGIGLANVINFLNPEVIILGGGLARARKLLIKPAQKMIKKLVLAPAAKNTPIIVSELGKEAGILGATLLFWDNFLTF